MTNNERFNAALNSCQNPRAIFSALQTLAPVPREDRAPTKGELLDTIMELTEDEAVELLAQWKKIKKEDRQHG